MVSIGYGLGGTTWPSSFMNVQASALMLFRGSPNQRIIYLHGAPPEDRIPGTVELEPLR